MGPDELAELYSDGRRSKDPIAIARDIEHLARTPGRLTHEVESSVALAMAAELCQRAGNLDEALRLVETAMAWRAHDDNRASIPALFGEVLGQQGYREESLRVLRELRPAMVRSFVAAFSVPKALARSGEPDLGIEWITAAIDELAPRVQGAYGEVSLLDRQLLHELLVLRARARRSMGYQPDRLDSFADQSESSMLPAIPSSGRLALLYWPRTEYEAFARMWPDLALGYGNGSWAKHRTEVERMLEHYLAGSYADDLTLMVVPAVLDEFLDYAAEEGLDPKSGQARSAYASGVGTERHGIRYAPRSWARCWCGADRKFRRCCGDPAGGLIAGWAWLFPPSP